MEKGKISKLDSFGRGITYLNKIVFLKNALVDEEVEYEIKEEKKNYIKGRVINRLNDSKMRILPICPYYDICGGCDFMHASYSLELDFKYEKVKNALSSFTKNILPIVYLEREGYRNKITLHVDDKLGLYKVESHEVCPILKCELVLPKINEVISILNTLDLDGITSICIRCSSYFDDCMVIFYGNKDITPFKDKFKDISLISYNGSYQVVKGNGFIKEKIGDTIYHISASSFFQVNTSMAELLYAKVLSYLDNSSRVLDLYCGVGSISLFIANGVKSVKGIEINKDAIMDAKISRDMNKIENVSFECLSTSDIKEDFSLYDTIIIDPPRSGLNKKTCNDLLESKVETIIYVSCDLMTLKRDLQILSSRYDVIEVTPFNLFGNTYHVENVCYLKLKK